MTPLRSTPCSRDATATYAPRSLKAPVGWSDSALRYRPGTGPNGTSGVRTAIPRRRSAAARMSASVTRASGSLVVGIDGSAVTRGQALAIDAAGRPRQSVESVRRDRAAAPDARAVGV